MTSLSTLSNPSESRRRLSTGRGGGEGGLSLQRLLNDDAHCGDVVYA